MTPATKFNDRAKATLRLSRYILPPVFASRRGLKWLLFAAGICDSSNNSTAAFAAQHNSHLHSQTDTVPNVIHT